MSSNSRQKTRFGFVSVVGLPNAGKSTLMNALVGSKVSIVSKKVQTTRMRVLGIALHEQTQLVIIDTPGIFQAQKTLEKAMVSAAWETMSEGDVVMHLVDVSTKNYLKKNEMIIRGLPKDRPVFLILNKTDAIKKEALLTITQELNALFDYKATYMISALKKQGLKQLLNGLSDLMPEGQWMYEEDQITDMPMRLMAAEITREQVFRQLHEEVPYSVFVETEHWEQFDNGSVKISQLIYVQRDSQKAIILGKGGARIKKIGQRSREELEEIMGCKVHLKIFVKVQENWQERAEIYQLMGLDIGAGR